MNALESCYAALAAAYVRGQDSQLPLALVTKPLDSLTDREIASILEAGTAQGLKLYRFKRTHILPRVKYVIGFLRGISFDTLLDVGSGRGVFLWPFLDAFPWVNVWSVDLLADRVAFLQSIARGGFSTLHSIQGDFCRVELPDQSRDVVTMLEVLEHIPDTQAALRAAVRIARKYIVLSVPSKPDNNPEHIHLFTKKLLTEHFEALGCTKLQFGAAPGHLLLIVSLT